MFFGYLFCSFKYQIINLLSCSGILRSLSRKFPYSISSIFPGTNTSQITFIYNGNTVSLLYRLPINWIKIRSQFTIKTKDKPGLMHKGFHRVYYAPHEKLVCFDYRKGRGRNDPDCWLFRLITYYQDSPISELIIWSRVYIY